jgi:benzoate membrane transport protein
VVRPNYKLPRSVSSFWRDLSISAIIAGFVAVLVGFTSSAAIVFAAAKALNATTLQTASWMWALGLGMGLTCIGLSLAYRQPILTAWSTPGAALIATGSAGISLQEATGAFLVCAALIIFFGFSGWFERLMSKVPVALASALLAGVLVKFVLQAFSSIKTQPILAIAMMLAYLLSKRLVARYAVPIALLVGLIVAFALGLVAYPEQPALGLALQMASPVWVMPEFSWQAVIGLGVPMFIVTMASQNIPGVATLRVCGYDAPVSPLIGWTGVASAVLAPFGCYALNLAAITAAICMSEQADQDPKRRYTASVMAGVFYCIIGLLAGVVTLVFSALPAELIAVIAGLALLATLGNGLAMALKDESVREPALICFAVTASGLTIMGIGSAFWGLVAGLAATLLIRPKTVV